jgi:ribonuclease BN (tRNA processing enzyme)
MRSLWIAAALGFCLLSPAGAQENPTGTWKAEEVAFAPWTFMLKAEGSTLTGAVSQGEANSSTGVTTSLTGATEIQEGKVEGAHISFQCTSPGGDRTIKFAGIVNGDVITFDRTVQVRPGGDPGMNGIYGASGASHFVAKRASASTAGTAPRPLPPPAPVTAPSNSKEAKVVILGTGTPIPDPDRSGPAIAVCAGGRAYLVDAGPGVVRRARQAADRNNMPGLRPISLDVLFLTHLHSDHTVGYPDLILTPAVLGRAGPLQVYGPKGTQEMTDHLLAAWKKDIDVRVNGLEHESAARYKVNVHENRPGEIYKDANVTVRAFLVKHATWDEAFGYRFDTAGRSIVISGDTAPTPAIAVACNGCDILVHEVYCNGGGSPYFLAAHTSAAELADIAKQAKPKLLVLYHQLYSGGCSDDTLLQQVGQKYAGKVVSAKDLDVF